MPFIDSEELNKRRSSPSNLANRLSKNELGEPSFPQPSVEHHITGTKKEGDNEIPLPIKKTLSLLANETPESQKSIAREFGVSQPSVSYFKRGKVDSERRSNPELLPVIAKIKDRQEEAKSKAIDIVLQGLGAVPDKLEGASLNTLMRTAKTASEIARNVSGKDEESKPQVMLHMWVPENKSVKDYDFIDVTPVSD